jgi:hypothetical protein
MERTMAWKTILSTENHSLEQNYINKNMSEFYVFHYRTSNSTSPYREDFVGNDPLKAKEAFYRISQEEFV